MKLNAANWITSAAEEDYFRFYSTILIHFTNICVALYHYEPILDRNMLFGSSDATIPADSKYYKY